MSKRSGSKDPSPEPVLPCAGVNAMLRKVAVAAASKPHVEIRQDGDQFYIKTSTTVRTTEINFKVGEGFEEETVDGRKCRVRLYRPHLLPGYLFQPLARYTGRTFFAGCVTRGLCDLLILSSGESPTPFPMPPPGRK